MSSRSTKGRGKCKDRLAGRRSLTMADNVLSSAEVANEVEVLLADDSGEITAEMQLELQRTMTTLNKLRRQIVRGGPRARTLEI
eukprot:12394419-Heterocapsa_arctica.AAC.1